MRVAVGDGKRGTANFFGGYQFSSLGGMPCLLTLTLNIDLFIWLGRFEGLGRAALDSWAFFPCRH